MSRNDEKTNRDNRANQLNPNNDAYWDSRGEEPPGGRAHPPLDQAGRDNRSRQLNPQDPLYERSRGNGASNSKSES